MMRDVIERLTKQANELDAKGMHENADELDSIIQVLATGMGMGFKGMKTPEERARDRVMMSGQDDEKLYQRYLAEERAKDAVSKSKPQEQPSKAKVREESGFVLNFSKDQLLAEIKKNPAQEQVVKQHLVPALNEAIGGPRIPGVPTTDVYSGKGIDEILEAAEKLNIIPKAKPWYRKIF